ncbi:PH domain-containing protein [Kitasatospora sp. LaBMicrA B282]|uniref:PH domain-containing protein n=1 Tax=Kitasatospora sp. LaBMicrA B282 TaxID=3420949 RepID=UPI003D122A18
MPHSLPGEPDLDFRVPAHLRCRWLAAVLVALVGYPALALHLFGYGAVGAWVAATTDLALLLLLGGGVRNRTAADRHGVSFRWGLLPARTVPWPEIASIRVEPGPLLRWKPQRSVHLTTTTGRRHRLPALTDGELLAPDPEFDARTEQLIAAWERHRAVAG